MIRWPLAGVVLVLLVACLPARAQAPSDPADPPKASVPGKPDANEVTTGAGQVGVDSPEDRRIARRIEQVLTATGRFTNLSVEVESGVVFLRGEAETEAMRELAADLARRTDGVAAVVNDLGLSAQPILFLAPLREDLRTFAGDLARLLPLFLAGFLVFAGSVLLAMLVGKMARGAIRHVTDSELLRNVLGKALALLVLLLGAYLALQVSGLTRIALAVISGTGLIGLALGFAFRDIAENFLASLLLSIQRPFRVGDVIEVDGHTGIVRKVTSRGTLLMDYDGNHIQIANSRVYKQTIKNLTANPKMRLGFRVGIGYDDDVAHAQAVAHEATLDHPAVLDDPEPLVLVEELGASTVSLRIYFWIDAVEHSRIKVRSSVMRTVLQALQAEGVSMPDEAREVIFPQGVPVDLRREGESPTEPVEVSPPARRTRAKAASGETVVEAEGDLTSEVAGLKRQADRARDPEEGANVLE